MENQTYLLVSKNCEILNQRYNSLQDSVNAQQCSERDCFTKVVSILEGIHDSYKAINSEMHKKEQITHDLVDVLISLYDLKWSCLKLERRCLSKIVLETDN